MNKICLMNAMIVLEKDIIFDAFLLISSGVIKSYGPMATCPKFDSSFTIVDCSSNPVIPGMIDIHVHGAGGADFMDATPEAFDTVARSLAKEGTTSYLATTMTNPTERIHETLCNIANYREFSYETGKAEMLGIHLEGPFINVAQKGAQPAASIKSPDIGLFDEWQESAKGAIRIVTYAPELDTDHIFSKGLQERGIIGSMGHTDATYEEANQAIDEGVTHATHLFNGMKGLHHREPGVVGAALLNEEVHVEVIPDGYHFHPDLLKVVLKMKGLERILVITDGIRAKGMPDGEYDLGGSNVVVRCGKCMLEDGTSLAGSIVTMNDARRNMAEWLGLTLPELAQITSLNQARRLGIDEKKGSIAIGKDADIVILNEDGEVVLTLCKGKIAYLHEDSFPKMKNDFSPNYS